MKKLLSLTTAFAMAASMTVGAALPLANNAGLGEFTPLQKTDGRVKISKDANNLMLTKAAQKRVKSPRKGGSIDGGSGLVITNTTPITEAPAGTVQAYSRSTDMSFYYSYFGLGYESVESNLTELVFTEDGSVYFKNPVSEYATETYLKGTLKDGIVTFNLPQPILDYYGDIYYADLQTITIDWNEGSIDYEASENQTLQFKYEDGVLTSLLDSDTYLSLASEEGAWAGYGDTGITLTPFNEKALTDVNLEGKAYNLLYDGGGHAITIAKDGDDLYLKGVFEAVPDSWIKGTKSGDKYVFEPQFVGAISGSPAYLLAVKTEARTKYYEDYDYSYDYTAYIPAGNLELNYDAEKDVYSVDEGISIVAYIQTEFEEGEEFYSPLAAYSNAYAKVPGDVENAKPSAPYDLSLTYSSYYEEYWFDYSFNNITEEGEILDKDKLFYNVYIDGEVWTFDTEMFDVEEEIVDIPYSYYTSWSFYSYGEGNMELAFSMEGFETLGVQMIYRPSEGKEIRSDIVTLNAETGEVTTEEVENPYAGVSNISLDKAVNSVVYYDIQGRRVVNPSNGLFIKKVTYADGTVKVSKIAK